MCIACDIRFQWNQGNIGDSTNMVNPSLDPTRPDGSELPTFSYGGEGVPRALKQYRFLRIDIFSQYGEVINSINPIDEYRPLWPELSLTQVMAWCLTDAKPSPEPILIYSQLHPWEHISVIF